MVFHDYASYQLDSYYRYQEMLDEIVNDGYEDYPEKYEDYGDNNEGEFAYAHGAGHAYNDNPQRLLNHLIGCVL